MAFLKGPRFWLMVALGVGALGFVYVIGAASVKPREHAGVSARNLDKALLTGEMADFRYVFPPRGAPEISFDREGAPVTLADFRGRAVLVNFWATYCLPCVAELPSLNALQEKFADRPFEVVAIAADPTGPENARKFLARHEIDALPLYTDPRLTLASALGADILPLSILYDADGREIGRLYGEADWMAPESVRLVASVIP